MAKAVGVLLRWDHGTSGGNHQSGRWDGSDEQRDSMKSDISELVIERPSAATIRDIARIVSGRRVELDTVRLTGDPPTLRQILGRWSDGDVRMIDAQSNEAAAAQESDGEIQVTFGPSGSSQPNGSPRRTSDSSIPVANGGDVVTPHLGGDSLPGRDDYPTTDDWVADTAERIGIGSDSLIEIAATVNEGERAAQIRHLLELAFEQHLDRPNKGGRGYVEIRTAGSSVGHYHYLDNGRGRGGAHYFRGLTPDMKETIRRIAIEEHLAVLVEGEAYLSVSFERQDIVEDVRFVELILLSAFESTLADIVAIEEFVGREVACSWIT